MYTCALDGEPGSNRHPVARKSLVAPVNKRPSIRWQAGELCPPEEPVDHVRGHGITRFDFHRVKKVSFLDKEVDLMACPIAPEEYGRRSPVVQIGLRNFCNHVVLKNRPPEWVRDDLDSLTDTKKLTKQSCVVEVELGAFDHPLLEVPVMGGSRKTMKLVLRTETHRRAVSTEMPQSDARFA
jgi:hypothetical protein